MSIRGEELCDIVCDLLYTFSTVEGFKVSENRHNLFRIEFSIYKLTFVFLLGFLITHLECRSCEMNLEQNWAFKIFLDMGVPISTLLMAYATLIRVKVRLFRICLLYTSPSPRDGLLSRMPSSA